MMDPVDLPNLHDAVLERIEINWKTGEVTIDVIRVPGGALRLAGGGVLAFDLSRREAWGPSISINEAHLRRTGDDELTLEIELQSGDTLSMTATQVVVTPR